MPPNQPPKPPAKLGKAGSSFWRKTHSAYILDEVQSEMLFRACCQLDRADQAAAVLAKDGLTVENRFGSTTAHPMIAVESNAIALFRHLARQLNIIAEE